MENKKEKEEREGDKKLVMEKNAFNFGSLIVRVKSCTQLFEPLLTAWLKLGSW
jgi:hypothetical protein